MAKQMVFDDEARQPLAAGVSKLARAVARELRHAADEHRVDQIVIVAAPDMLGHLRSSMDPYTRSLVVDEVTRDLAKLSDAELHARLRDELPLQQLTYGLQAGREA